MKKYGIYIAYPPTVDLRLEGLGRHLAEFLKASEARGDLRFVIACPSWMHANLAELFESRGIRLDSFEFLSPDRQPLVLTLYETYLKFKSRPRWPGLFKSLGMLAVKLFFGTQAWMERQIVSARNPAVPLTLALLALPLIAAVALPCGLLWLLLQPLRAAARGIAGRLRKQINLRALIERTKSILLQPKGDTGAVRWYRLMMEAEVGLLHKMINARKDIGAWYSPTAFWPHFHGIEAPRLMCVPDVVLADFPVGFAPIGGERTLGSFREVERAIHDGEFFVTYSEEIKWGTLVDRYHVDPRMVDVVPHGANRLDELVIVSGFPDNEAATDTLCRNLFRSALAKAVNFSNPGIYGGKDVRFLFYASQFRPNKNIISLLRAYEYLLKRRHIGHKLVLTGNPTTPEVERFIREHNLANDVLCLPGLSAQELAACYHLADLAVNPSLSEGGCPFTFCEALSVGTPVVMARIAVTEEIITDAGLQSLMLFDPYDWMDMAGRIEWALHNLPLLKARQTPFYEQLAQRTWRQVVDEHVAILDRISSEPSACKSDRAARPRPSPSGEN